MEGIYSASAAPDETPPDSSEARRVRAERDLLLELVAVFTHDLSNPLQTITVLCELGFEGDDGGAQQCLEAAERMRGLIHGLAGFSRQRGRVTSIGTTLSRVCELLACRLERYALAPTFDAGRLDEVPAPSGLEFAAIALCLGMITAASERTRAEGELVVRGVEDGDVHAIRISATVSGKPLLPAAEHIAQAREIIEPAASVEQDADGIEIRWSVQT